MKNIKVRTAILTSAFCSAFCIASPTYSQDLKQQKNSQDQNEIRRKEEWKDFLKSATRIRCGAHGTLLRKGDDLYDWKAGQLYLAAKLKDNSFSYSLDFGSDSKSGYTRVTQLVLEPDSTYKFYWKLVSRNGKESTVSSIPCEIIDPSTIKQ